MLWEKNSLAASRNKDVFISEIQGKCEKYIGRNSFASGRRRNTSKEEQERDSTRWEMAVGPRPSRSGALNFLWNLLTIKYELARSVILNFRMCPHGFVLPIRGTSVTLSRRLLPHSIRAAWNVVREIYPSSSSSRYLIFMKDSGSQTRSRRKTVEDEMTTVYRDRRKKGKLRRKGFDDESDFQALSPVNPLRERWKILRQNDVLQCIFYRQLTEWQLRRSAHYI